MDLTRGEVDGSEVQARSRSRHEHAELLAALGNCKSTTAYTSVCEDKYGKMEGYRLRFLLKLTYDVLPRPSCLQTWGLKDNARAHGGKPEQNLTMSHQHVRCGSRTQSGRRSQQVRAAPGERSSISYRVMSLVYTAENQQNFTTS